MKEAEKVKRERDEYLAGWQRAKADFSNYKKEEAARMSGAARHAQERLLLSFLPVVDSLERAEGVILKDTEAGKGVTQIAEQARFFLTSQGVQSLKARGKPFDPEFHEALEMVEGGESGIVAEEVEKGYVFGDRLLRPAKVRVYK